jgi:Acetyltransferase (GNAT) family
VLLEDRCPMKLFVGYLDDDPVASSELFLSGRIAGLYSVCTRRECRGRGIGSTLTWVALDYARCRGIPTAVLQSSNDGQGLYLASEGAVLREAVFWPLYSQCLQHYLVSGRCAHAPLLSRHKVACLQFVLSSCTGAGYKSVRRHKWAIWVGGGGMVCLCTDLCRPLPLAVVGRKLNRFLQSLLTMQRFQQTPCFLIAAIGSFCYEPIRFRRTTADS